MYKDSKHSVVSKKYSITFRDSYIFYAQFTETSILLYRITILNINPRNLIRIRYANRIKLNCDEFESAKKCVVNNLYKDEIRVHIW